MKSICTHTNEDGSVCGKMCIKYEPRLVDGVVVNPPRCKNHNPEYKQRQKEYRNRYYQTPIGRENILAAQRRHYAAKKLAEAPDELDLEADN